MKIVVVGGGAAGFFGAITAKAENPNATVILLEKTATLLAKVRISGGGRCNVTHSCFDPKELIKNYPRGHKALLGPFTRFQPTDTIQWFKERGVSLKTEVDGRMFPITDSSETIIDCLMNEAKRLKVDIRLKQRIKSLKPNQVIFEEEILECNQVLLATGSSHQGLDFARALGHTIVEPVPSLFTFNIKGFSLIDLAGVAAKKVKIKLSHSSLEQIGPMLITHWGFSGPAALKLSAWAARELQARNYQTDISVDWLPDHSKESIVKALIHEKQSQQIIGNRNIFDLSKNLWLKLLELSGVDSQKKIRDLNNAALNKLSDLLKNHLFQMDGKTTHKDEFVTAGGVKLDEVNFKTMESRITPGLYFAGEILDIDGVTGGFNFQNAWTTGYLAGLAMGK